MRLRPRRPTPTPSSRRRRNRTCGALTRAEAWASHAGATRARRLTDSLPSAASAAAQQRGPHERARHAAGRSRSCSRQRARCSASSSLRPWRSPSGSLSRTDRPRLESERRASSATTISRRSSDRPRSAATSRARFSIRPSTRSRLSIALGLLVYQQQVKGGVTLRTILFSTYVAPMIAVALVWSKLYSPTEGRSTRSSVWSVCRRVDGCLARHGARLDRHPQCLAAGRLFHDARGRGPHADSARAHRGGSARRCGAAAAVRFRNVAAAPTDAALFHRHRRHQRGAGVRAGGAHHSGRSGRLDQRGSPTTSVASASNARRAGSARRWR
jgi:hypothetical protein